MPPIGNASQNQLPHSSYLSFSPTINPESNTVASKFSAQLSINPCHLGYKILTSKSLRSTERHSDPTGFGVKIVIKITNLILAHIHLAQWGLAPLARLRYALVLTSVLVAVLVSVSCTQILFDPQNPKTQCANIDWYEIGRTDGVTGSPSTKVGIYQTRCDSTPFPVKIEYYSNGREAGLIEYCSPTGGLEAGKSGATYEKVCPGHLEAAFLSNFHLGTKIHGLTSESADLEARIQNLVSLLKPNQTGGSMHAQIDLLKTRQTLISSEISSLEKKAGEM